jgi:hypothetical protein
MTENDAKLMGIEIETKGIKAAHQLNVNANMNTVMHEIAVMHEGASTRKS